MVSNRLGPVDPDSEPTLSDQTRVRPALPRSDAPVEADDEDQVTVARPLAQAPEPRPIQRVVLDGRYRLAGKIGQGGMGEVWEARHVQLDRPVAIKFLTDRAGQPRFVQEAQAIAAIRHRGIVDVIDFGVSPEGVPYFVMELLEGETLAARGQRERRLSWAFVRTVAIEVSEALAHAHAAGVIHRDLKPTNVVVLDAPPPRGSSTKLIDFGIAKRLDVSQPRLTRTGRVQGTPAYMSPEQVLGDPVDARADVYGLGCLLYKLLTGRRPFADKAGSAALRAQVYERVPSFAEVTPGRVYPPGVEALVMKAMAKSREDRFASMAELRAAIVAIPAEPSPAPGAELEPVSGVGPLARRVLPASPPPSAEVTERAPAIHQAKPELPATSPPRSAPRSWPWIVLLGVSLAVMIATLAAVLAR